MEKGEIAMWTGFTTEQTRKCILLIQKHKAKALFSTQGTIFMSSSGDRPEILEKELLAHGAKEVVFI